MVEDLYLSERAHKRDGFSVQVLTEREWWVGRWEPSSLTSRTGGGKIYSNGWQESISRNLNSVLGFLRACIHVGENSTKLVYW